MSDSAQYRPYHLVYKHPGQFHGVYIGDLNAANNLNFLCSHNIRTVITAALGFDQLDYQDLPIKHIVYPLLDSNQQDIAQFFAQFYVLMERQIRVGNVLVHCSAGISRSATLVLSYLMRKEQWTFRKALQMVRKSGRQVLPNLGFERQLKAYEKTILPKSAPSNYHHRSGNTNSANEVRGRTLQSHPYKLPSLQLLQLNSQQLSINKSKVMKESRDHKSTKSSKQVGNRIRWALKDQRAQIRIKMQSEKGRRVSLLSRQKQQQQTEHREGPKQVNNFSVVRVPMIERVRRQRLPSRIYKMA